MDISSSARSLGSDSGLSRAPCAQETLKGPKPESSEDDHRKLRSDPHLWFETPFCVVYNCN